MMYIEYILGALLLCNSVTYDPDFEFDGLVHSNPFVGSFNFPTATGSSGILELQGTAYVDKSIVPRSGDAPSNVVST